MAQKRWPLALSAYQRLRFKGRVTLGQLAAVLRTDIWQRVLTELLRNHDLSDILALVRSRAPVILLKPWALRGGIRACGALLGRCGEEKMLGTASLFLSRLRNWQSSLELLDSMGTASLQPDSATT